VAGVRAPWRRPEAPSLVELGVIDDADTARLATLLLCGAGGLGLLTTALALVAGPRPADFHPLPIMVISALAVAAGLVVRTRSELVPADRAAALLAASAVPLGVVAYLGGREQLPYIAMFYIWLGGAKSYMPRRHVYVLLALAAVSLAFVLALQPGHPTAPTQWILMVGTIVVATIPTNWMVARITSLALDERATREELETANLRLEEVNKQKRDFLAATSHELRTPLNAIIGFSEVLGDELYGSLNQRQAEYVGDIRTSGQHLKGLIGEVLDVVKVESGRLELEPGPVDLGALLAGAVVLFREQAARRSIMLELEPAHLGSVECDERKLRQVLVNLLANAMKFTPEGGRVTVRARAMGDLVEIAVTDTGAGIALQDQERIFEAFEQAPAGIGVGTGLGLPLARRFVEAHGGRLELASLPGAGSTFTVMIHRRLPLNRIRFDVGALGTTVDDGSDEVRRQYTRVFASMAVGGSVLTFVALIANLVFPPDAPLPQFRAFWSVCLATPALAAGIAALLRPTALDVPRGLAFAATLLVAATFGAYHVGPVVSPYVTSWCVWVALALFMLLPSRWAALLSVAGVGAALALLLAVQPGNYFPAARWTLTMGVCLVSGTAMGWLVTKLQSLTEAEKAARLDVERSWMELEQVSRHKSEFLANMSHELRTPLNAIIGFADVLREGLFGTLNPKQTEYIIDIVDAGKQLLTLINDILDLAKAEAGRIELTVDAVAVADLVHAGLEPLLGSVKQRRLQVDIDIDAQVVHGDAVRLGRAVASLISNAVKFSPEAGRVQVQATCDDGEFALTVRDQGPGIPAHEHARIFDEFQQVVPAGLAIPGSGLGLTLARTFVELHSGRLELESEPGKGSTFRLAIPQPPEPELVSEPQS
jgi:signal transduction histidine kinase